MNKSKLKNYKMENLDETSIQLNILQNARVATILFIFGCFLNFIEYDYSEKAIFQSMSNIDKSVIRDNEIKAAVIAKYVSIIFLIAIIIFADNAFTVFELNLSNIALDRTTISSKSNKSNIQSSRIIALFDFLKVLGYFGAFIGYSLDLENLENS